MAVIETRTADDGSLSYRAKIRIKGYPPQTSTFTRKTDARRWAQSVEASIREGRHFKTAEAKKHTLADLIDRYDREVLALKPKYANNARQHLAWWRNRLGVYALSDVSTALIVEARNELLRTPTRRKTLPAAATVVRYLASLSHAFTVAVDEWGWIDDSPMRKVKRPTEARGRERFLSDDERTRLLDACERSISPYLYTVVVLALSTGMRRGEIMGLRWGQVHLHDGFILLTETKNNTSRSAALSGLALDLMTQMSRVRRIDSDLVFVSVDPKKSVELTKAWMTALRKADLNDFRFHDLRHSAASYLAMNGASTIEIAAILGHKTLQMVKRYSHLANSHTLQVVRSMNDKMFSARRRDHG